MRKTTYKFGAEIIPRLAKILSKRNGKTRSAGDGNNARVFRASAVRFDDVFYAKGREFG